MQPENQQSGPPASPGAPIQPSMPPTSPAPVSPPQVPSRQAVPPVQPASPPPAPLPLPQPTSVLPAQPQPIDDPAPNMPQSSTMLPTAEALGSIAVNDQVEDGYGFDSGDPEEFDEEIDLTDPIKWQAREYIHQEKDVKWFILFGIVIAAFMAIAILLMQSWTFAVLLVVIAIMVVVLAKRPPRVMDYALSNEGLHIGDTLHRFTDFKSFGIIRDGEEFSVMLIPRRRLQPGITVYFPEEAGEDIVDALGSRLPMKELHLDVIDRLVRKLRL